MQNARYFISCRNPIFLTLNIYIFKKTHIYKELNTHNTKHDYLQKLENGMKKTTKFG